jgi:hypothetical protein
LKLLFVVFSPQKTQEQGTEKFFSKDKTGNIYSDINVSFSSDSSFSKEAFAGQTLNVCKCRKVRRAEKKTFLGQNFI